MPPTHELLAAGKALEALVDAGEGLSRWDVEIRKVPAPQEIGAPPAGYYIDVRWRAPSTESGLTGFSTRGESLSAAVTAAARRLGVRNDD